MKRLQEAINGVKLKEFTVRSNEGQAILEAQEKFFEAMDSAVEDIGPERTTILRLKDKAQADIEEALAPLLKRLEG